MYETSAAPGALTGLKTGYANGPMQVQPVGHIPDAMAEMDKLTLTLADELSALEQRLCTILRPTAPMATGPSDAATRPAISPFAEGLAGFNSRLYAQIQRVRDLSARADL